MTLIQASICNNYNAVLLIGDRMVTVNYGEVEYQTESKTSKLYTFDKFGIGFAGALTDIHAVVNEIDKKKTWNSIQEFGIYVSNIIKSVIRKQKEEIVAKYTFKTLDEFIADSNGNAGTIPLELKEGVYAELTKFEFNCQALVIGFNVNSEGSIYSIDENGTLSKISDEFCSSIGTGEPFSQIYFDQHDYDVQCSLSQGLFLAYSAKKSAEFHTGVGKKTDIIVLQAGEPVKEITSESNEM